MLRILAVDRDPDRGRLAPLDAPVAARARRVDDGDGLARRRTTLESLIERTAGSLAMRERERIAARGDSRECASTTCEYDPESSGLSSLCRASDACGLNARATE